MLGALQNNGGATRTHALLTGSPAIDKGSNTLAFNEYTKTPLATDQRGSARFVDGDGNGTPIVDIGAFELQMATTAAGVTVGGRVQATSGLGISNISVTLTAANGTIQTAISGASGYFEFTDVPAGETYIFSASAKRYQFSQPTLVRTITEDTKDINFFAVKSSAKSF
jgi:hypothetical protein